MSSVKPQRFHVETLGCPKNDVDSDKIIGTLLADGMEPSVGPGDADLIVVNTCAFIEPARRESIDTVLALSDQRRDGARVVVTGCMAERYGEELAAALPEADAVVGFGQAVAAPSRRSIPVAAAPLPSFDLLNLPRPASSRPWAYVKIAEGCDRSCGFCAIPSFRGPQRSRDLQAIVDEAVATQAREIVLVAQDLAAYGRDRPGDLGSGAIVDLVRAVSDVADRVRLLYLYPSDLNDQLLDAIIATGVPYFDLSLQHVNRDLLRRMRRWGDEGRFRDRIERIRELAPDAALRSNFIVGYPGETEQHHDDLLGFVHDMQLDWCGFFEFSPEEGTAAMDLDGHVPPELIAERIAELRDLQDSITAARRDDLIGTTQRVLVDSAGVARSHREAPEIDGVIHVDPALIVGDFADVTIIDALGPDLVADGAHPDEDV